MLSRSTFSKAHARKKPKTQPQSDISLSTAVEEEPCGAENIDPGKHLLDGLSQGQALRKSSRVLTGKQKAKRKLPRARGSRHLRTSRKNSVSKCNDAEEIKNILCSQLQGMRMRKISEEYLEKLDSDGLVLRHTHQRKVSFQSVTNIRVFQVDDKPVDFDDEYDDLLLQP